MFFEKRYPSYWKEWYTKDGAAKAASFQKDGRYVTAIYLKHGEEWKLSGSHVLSSMEQADSTAVGWIINYDETKVTKSSDSSKTDEASL